MPKENKIRKSLRNSFIDGIFASCMVGLTSDYIVPYALALKASVRQIGILSAIPNLASSVVQFFSPDLTERFKSRKKTINTFIFLHVLMGIPIILIPYLFKEHMVFFLIIFVTLFNSFNALAAPAWSSLMSDHVPARSRGKYFGWRNKINGILTVVSAFSAGVILQYFKHNVFRGFFIVFTLAFACRFISWCYLTRMYEPPFKIRKDSYFSFLDFIRRVKESNFAKFVIFVASLNFCVNIASPYFSVFMLKDLKFNYLTYTIVVITVTIVNIFTIDRWGKHADKVGNLKVLRLTSFFIASLPLWWIFNQHPAYLVLIQIISGFAWAGFNLCASNFIFDAVTPEKRTRCVAYFNVFSGIALCLGALLGSYLVNIMPGLFGFRLLSLFLLSSIMRFIIVFLFSGRIKEVRPIQAISSRDLFYSVVGIKPMLGVTQDSRQLVSKEE